MGESARRDFLLAQWETASQLHRHMDQMAWQSLSYFAALNGALLSIFAVILSSEWLKPPLKAFLGMLIAGFGLCASCVWSKVHKRMQLYHRLRSNQANAKERELRNSVSSQTSTPNDDLILIYDDKLIQENKDIMDSVPHSSWGKMANYELVFRLARGLMVAWIVVLALTLALFTIALIAECAATPPAWATCVLSGLFVPSPVQP